MPLKVLCVRALDVWRNVVVEQVDLAPANLRSGPHSWGSTMIRQIVIEAEPADDAQSMFRLSINANLIAKGVTVAQAYYLVGEVLRRNGAPGTR